MNVRVWPFSAAPIVLVRVRYRRSCCRTGRVVGEAVETDMRATKAVLARRYDVVRNCGNRTSFS